MSIQLIQAALETELNKLPAIATSWSNTLFEPTNSALEYQTVRLQLGAQTNNTFGADYSQKGLLKVKLYYPAKTGIKAALARAELIKAAFAYRKEIIANGTDILIYTTPEIMTGAMEASRYTIIVNVRFSADIKG